MPFKNSYRKLDTKTLINNCVQKNPLSWSEFIVRHSPLVYRAIRKRLQNHNFQFNNEDIEDLRQGFFIKLWQEGALEKVKNSSNINYWICMVAANFATDFYRRSRKDILNNAVSIFEDVVINKRNISALNFIKSNIFTPQKKIEKKYREGLIENALSELSHKEKIAFKLSIYHNKRYRAISKILKVSLGNVSSILRRAKKKIREKLQQNW